MAQDFVGTKRSLPRIFATGAEAVPRDTNAVCHKDFPASPIFVAGNVVVTTSLGQLTKFANRTNGG
jgi:hypothetical protein